MTDEYLDAADFRLTTNDYWLRVRDGQVELKEVAGSCPPALQSVLMPFTGNRAVCSTLQTACRFTSSLMSTVCRGVQPIAVQPGASASMDRYVELAEPAAITRALQPFFPGLEHRPGANLREALRVEGCNAFCRIVSLRRKYGGDGGLSVDLDVISEPTHIDYKIGEVEVRPSPPPPPALPTPLEQAASVPLGSRLPRAAGLGPRPRPPPPLLPPTAPPPPLQRGSAAGGSGDRGAGRGWGGR